MDNEDWDDEPIEVASDEVEWWGEADGWWDDYTGEDLEEP